MMRFRLPFVLAAALLTTLWGAGDARVPASMRRLRGQPRGVVADAGVPDAIRADVSAVRDPERRPDSRRPAALPAVTLALPVISTPRREQHHTASDDPTPRRILPHGSRAPPRLA
jgi:hypothetical protein